MVRNLNSMLSQIRKTSANLLWEDYSHHTTNCSVNNFKYNKVLESVCFLGQKNQIFS